MDKDDDKEINYASSTNDHLHSGGGSLGGLGREKALGGMSQRPSLLCFYQVSETRAQMLGFHYSLGPLPLHAAGTVGMDNYAQEPGLAHAQTPGLAHSVIHRDVHVRLWTSRAMACRHNAMKIMEVEQFLQQEATYQKFGVPGFASATGQGLGLGRRVGAGIGSGERVSMDGYAYGLPQQGQQGLADGGSSSSGGGGQENVSGSGTGYSPQAQAQLTCHLPFAAIAGGVGCIAGRGSVAVVHQIWSLLAASLELLALTLSLSLGKAKLVG